MSSVSSVVVPKNILESLKCDECSLYLSVPPIMYTKKQKLICGRCFSLEEDSYCCPAKAFEIVAELLSFPCRYMKEGCSKQDLKWESVEDHELACNYQYYDCPSLECEWEGNSKMLFAHFAKEHKEQILNSNHFFFYLPLYTKCTYLRQINDDMFIIYAEKDIKRRKFWIGVYYVEEHDENFRYKLELLNSDSESIAIFKNSIQRHYSCFGSTRATLEIDFEMTRHASSKDNTVPFKISIWKSLTTEPKNSASKPILDENLLSALECSVCAKYVMPPIFTCLNGHNICEECKTQSSDCLKCKSPLGEDHNLLLEKLISYVNYPCKYQNSGCEFVGDGSTMNDHVTICTFKPIKCPLQVCLWEDVPQNCFNHISAAHSQKLWITNEKQITRDLTSWPLMDFNIMYYDGKLFKICCKHSLRPRGLIFLAFQQIGLKSNEASPYKFELEFVDQSDTGRKFVVDFLCCEITSDKDAFNNLLGIPYNLLTPFISSTRSLTFIYKIIKV